MNGNRTSHAFGFLVCCLLCALLCALLLCFDLVVRDLAGLLGQNSGQRDSKSS